MATRIGQYAPVCLPGDPSLPDREDWRATVYGVAQSWPCLKQPCAQRPKALCLRQLWPRGNGGEWGTAAGFGALAAPCVQGHGPPQEPWPYQGLFPRLCDQKASLASPSCSFAHWALSGLPCLGSLPVDQHTRHIEGPPPPHASALGSGSVARYISHLKEHPGGVPGCISAHPAFDGPASLRCWERGHGNGSTPTHDSAELPFFHGSRPFLHRHVPPQSPHSHPLHPPLHREQQPLP